MLSMEEHLQRQAVTQRAEYDAEQKEMNAEMVAMKRQLTSEYQTAYNDLQSQERSYDAQRSSQEASSLPPSSSTTNASFISVPEVPWLCCGRRAEGVQRVQDLEFSQGRTPGGTSAGIISVEAGVTGPEGRLGFRKT